MLLANDIWQTASWTRKIASISKDGFDNAACALACGVVVIF